MLSGRIQVTLSRLHYAANATAPSNKLPPELLCAVFFYLCPDAKCDWEIEQPLPYADLLAVSRVCRHWREVAVSATELWTHIIFSLGCNMSVKEEISTARLCLRRSGVQPLNFFYIASLSPSAEELIPDSRRLKSLVYASMDNDPGEIENLSRYLLPASNLERLEIRGNESFPLPSLFRDTAPPLRELTISRCTPWPNNRFGFLTSLNLLCQKDIDANVHSLSSALRCSPLLEELLIEREFGYNTNPSQPPPGNIPAIPLHSLKRLHICRLAAQTTRRLLEAFDLLPNGIFMRFTNVSPDLGAIFPETIAPEVSPLSATKLEFIYPSKGGVILHATNGVVHTRLAYRYFPRRGEFSRWMKKSHGEYAFRELWFHVDRDARYELPPPQALCDLETFVIEADPNERFNQVFFPMLSPNEGGVPLPLLSTLELRNVFGVAKFGEVLKARSDAGFRLKTLRLRWFEGCEERMAPLAQFVDRLEFYRVADRASRGLELPEECMRRGMCWEPWSRNLVGGMEFEPPLWTHEVNKRDRMSASASLILSAY